MTGSTVYRNNFYSLTGFLFKTFVFVPAVVFFVLLSLAAYSSGGIGNAVIEMTKGIGYNAEKNTYRTCIDKPVTLEVPQRIIQATTKFELRMPSSPKVTSECQAWEDVAADQKASILTSSISKFYASIVLIYWLSIALFRLFKPKAIKGIRCI